MTENAYVRGIQIIKSMNDIIRSLNDEDIVMNWLALGVPDGVFTVEDISIGYPNDEDFAYQFEELNKLFASLIRKATNNGYEKWLYIGE